MRLFLLVFVALTLSPNAFARRTGYSIFSVYTQAHHYSDILQDSANPVLDLPADASLNIDIRLYRVFSVMLVGGQALDSSRTFYGLGVRMDLPGIFFINGTVNDLIHRRRRKGINTYVAYSNLQVKEVNQPTATIGDRFALGMDFDITDDYFLNLEPSLYSQRGNRFFSIALGLGIEF